MALEVWPWNYMKLGVNLVKPGKITKLQEDILVIFGSHKSLMSLRTNQFNMKPPASSDWLNDQFKVV